MYIYIYISSLRTSIHDKKVSFQIHERRMQHFHLLETLPNMNGINKMCMFKNVFKYVTSYITVDFD